jgi:hypothetical protein
MSDNSEYWLVPEKDENGNETGYYTREPDGVSGMTVSALSEFCGLASGSTSAISNWLKAIENSDPETNTLPESMKPYAGKVLRLETNDLQGRLIIPDEVCQSIAEYYAFDARDYPGQKVARDNCRPLLKAGMRLFIWSKTGYQPQSIKVSSYNSYTLGRIGLHHSELTDPLRDGYFSCFDKMMYILQNLDIRLGYQLGEEWFDTSKGDFRYLEPDISIGKLFSSFFTSDYSQSLIEYQKEFDSRLNNPRVKKFWSQDLIKLKWKADRLFTEQQIRLKHFGASNPISEIDIDRVSYTFKPSPESGRPDTLPNGDPYSAYGYSERYSLVFSEWIREVFFKFSWRRYILDRDESGWMRRYNTFQSLPDNKRNAILRTAEGGLILGFEFYDNWLKQLPPGK